MFKWKIQAAWVNRAAPTFFAFLCMLVVLPGCSSLWDDKPLSTTTAEPVVTATPTITAATQVKRPIDAYLPSAEDIGVLFHYQLTLLGRCINDHGVQGSPQVSGDLTTYISTQLRDRVLRTSFYGLFDPSGASTTGYHTAATSTISVIDPAGGAPDIGRQCREQVSKTFAGGDSMTYSDVRVLPDGGPPDASGDSRYRATVAEWSACMKARGYTFADPLDPLRQFTHAGQASQQEINTAIADFNCKVSTNLVGVAVAVQSAIDQRYIDAHLTQLSAFTSSVQNLLRAAGQSG